MSIDKKEQILEAAIKLFGEKGFEGTSIRDLAAAADVNIAMINYYFGTKEKLFENLVEGKAASSKNILEGIVKDKALSDIQKIEKVIETYVERVFSNRTFHRIIHHELMINQREQLRNTIVELLFPNSQIIKGIIETGIKNGSFKKVDTELTVASLIGTINHITLSKKFCNKVLKKEDDYIPYQDPKFKKRVIDHLKQLLQHHLINHN